MTKLDLEAIKARCKVATPGPWYTSADDSNKIPKVFYEDLHLRKRRALAYGLSNDDQEFIAHARTDVPALVAEVEILRAALAEAVCEIGELDNYLDNFKAHW